MIYHFGECALDTQLYTVTRGGKSIRLRPKAFRVCLYLLEHRDHVVTREELCTQVWSGQFISQTTLEGVIRSVRQAVGDSGQVQGIVQTLRGYGYRFVAAVEECPSRGLEERPTFAARPYNALDLAVLPQTAASIVGVARGLGIEGAANAASQVELRAEVEEPHSLATDRRNEAQGRTGARSRRLGSWYTWRSGLATALVLLALLMGLGLWGSLGWFPPEPAAKTRIAVLPFLSLSAENDQTYFADGMTEELISQLSQIHGLTVIARTSVMQYKGTRKDVATIGRELGVGALLEGSVRRVDNLVRISAQLIDVASQSPLWSQEYDRELTGAIGIQRDIATRMVQRLKVDLTAEPGRLGMGPDRRVVAALHKRRLGQ